MAGDRQILIRVDQDIYDRVKAAAKEEDRSMAAVARETLRARFAKPTAQMVRPSKVRGPVRIDPRSELITDVPKAKPTKKCLHPITLRIGNVCRECGATV